MSEKRYHNADGDLDPHVIAHELEEAGNDYAHKKHAADLLEETKPAVRAELTNKVRKENLEYSRKEAEDIALASPEWRAHLYAMTDAVRDKNLALARWKAAQARFEAIRTAEATRRYQMRG